MDSRHAIVSDVVGLEQGHDLGVEDSVHLQVTYEAGPFVDADPDRTLVVEAAPRVYEVLFSR